MDFFFINGDEVEWEFECGTPLVAEPPETRQHFFIFLGIFLSHLIIGFAVFNYEDAFASRGLLSCLNSPSSGKIFRKFVSARRRNRLPRRPLPVHLRSVQAGLSQG